MLGATTTALGANAESNTEQLPSLRPSTTYSCTSCQIFFPTGEEQRTHMKEPWHINNLKRRIASLPPVPKDEFMVQIKKKVVVKKSSSSSKSASSDEEASESEDEESASPFQCLFCNQEFEDDDEGFTSNLEHMRTAHDLSIPKADSVVDMQSLVGYLSTEVRVWHECLYCGATKDSTQSIQCHMRDKKHCILNLDREPELKDFWESPPVSEVDSSEDEQPTKLSNTELGFSSGKVVESRDATTSTTTKKSSRRQDPAASMAVALATRSEEPEPSPLDDRPQLAPGRQLARREEMGITGVSEQARRALVLAEKKAQRSEAIARRAREWVYARGANNQQYDLLNTKMKMGRQNHKLMPR